MLLYDCNKKKDAPFVREPKYLGYRKMIGEKIKLLRTKNNLKQSDIAKIIGCSASAVGMYEQGRREPELSVVKKLAEYFGVSADYLLGEDEAGKELVPSIRKFLMSQDGLMFNGEELSDSDIEQIMHAVALSTTLLKGSQNE